MVSVLITFITFIKVNIAVISLQNASKDGNCFHQGGFHLSIIHLKHIFFKTIFLNQLFAQNHFQFVILSKKGDHSVSYM